MKFVKANMFVLICGVVAIAALTLRFTWVGSVQEETRTEMAERMDKAAQAVQLAQQSISLPNNPTFSSAVTQELIDKKKEIQNWIEQQSKQISALAAESNQKDRVTKDHVALLNGKPLEGFLPTIKANRDAHDLKEIYNQVFEDWLAQLLYSSKYQPGRNYDYEGSVPTATEVTAMLNQRAVADAANAPRVWGTPVNQGQNSAISKIETDRRTAGILANAASRIRIYANRNSFQIRGWYRAKDAPIETQIFEGVFDCWLQQDVVHAINAVNGKSRNVFESPVKRLEKIAVGAANAKALHGGTFVIAPGNSSGGGGVVAGNTADGGQLFLTQGLGGGDKNNNSGATGILMDPGKSMTARVGSGDWDVSFMTVVVHIDPSYLNKFIAELYRQNNGYTVVDVNVETLDPFELASNGYMYGNVPVVRADILVEALFFRNWTAFVIPEPYRLSMKMTDPNDTKKD